MAQVEWEPGHQRILIRGLPDAVVLEILAEKLRDLIMDGQIKGVSGMRNLSSDDKPLMMLQLKNDADAQAVLDTVTKHVPTDG
jgi:DNA gyrase/topoisomerase IV subunit A